MCLQVFAGPDFDQIQLGSHQALAFLGASDRLETVQTSVRLLAILGQASFWR